MNINMNMRKRWGPCTVDVYNNIMNKYVNTPEANRIKHRPITLHLFNSIKYVFICRYAFIFIFIFSVSISIKCGLLVQLQHPPHAQPVMAPFSWPIVPPFNLYSVYVYGLCERFNVVLMTLAVSLRRRNDMNAEGEYRSGLRVSLYYTRAYDTTQHTFELCFMLRSFISAAALT